MINDSLTLFSISPAQPSGPVLFSKPTKLNGLLEAKFEGLSKWSSMAWQHIPLSLPSAHIRVRVQISNGLKQRKPGQEPTKRQDLIHKTHKVGLYLLSSLFRMNTNSFPPLGIAECRYDHAIQCPLHTLRAGDNAFQWERLG